MEYALISLVAAVAFLNGANDVSKGVATLHGGGLSSARTAILWGTVWTVAGGLSAFFISTGLLNFTNVIISSGVNIDAGFGSAVSTGVIAWLALATWSGLPVSTTHSIVGAVAGVALTAYGVSAVSWGTFASKIIVPLLLSPVLAVLATLLIYGKGGKGTRIMSRISGYCLCLGERERACCPSGASASVSVAPAPSVEVGSAENCADASPLRINFADMVHWASSALTSFARGLNDTPKIVAISAAALAAGGGGGGVSLKDGFLIVVVAMGLGSYFKGLRVTETLSERITPMDRNTGIIANLSTSALVIAASKLGLPVSTTHVSGSSIIGIGLKNATGINLKVVREMLLAWAVTLPVSGLISALAYMAVT